MDMGEPYSKHELLSFHTVSKGALGECGLRGGYVETTNIHPGTVDQIYKIASINLSPNTTGQVFCSLTPASKFQLPSQCGGEPGMISHDDVTQPRVHTPCQIYPEHPRWHVSPCVRWVK